MGMLAKAWLPEDLFNGLTAAKTPEDIDALVATFVKKAEAGELKEVEMMPGAGDASAYGISKLAQTSLASLLGAAMAADEKRKGVLVNACCPGYVDTDMTEGRGVRPVTEGADTLVYLSTLPVEGKENPQGEMVAERKVLDWRKGMAFEDIQHLMVKEEK